MYTDDDYLEIEQEMERREMHRLEMEIEGVEVDRYIYSPPDYEEMFPDEENWAE